jgi:hypothetical protein
MITMIQDTFESMSPEAMLQKMALECPIAVVSLTRKSPSDRIIDEITKKREKEKLMKKDMKGCLLFCVLWNRAK